MADSNSKKKSKKSSAGKTIIIGLFCLLCIYYVFLRYREAQEYNSAGESGNPQSTAEQLLTPQESTEANIQSIPSASEKPAETPIPYTLNGENGKRETDSNGNVTDTSNWLTAIGRTSDVLPKGFSLNDIPYYYGDGVIEVNGNVPYFTRAEIELAEQGPFEYYGALDSLGRCTVAFDCVGRETMPGGTKRGNISSIHPSGWKQARYDCVDSETVMTRAHLAGYMLSSENANKCNLITGTRYMNSYTMLPYEEQVANWLDHNRGKHVLYRVTPWYEGTNLMADGILMEAYSVEDSGRSIQYCVYVYNVQPGLKFTYATGASRYSGIFFDTKGETVVTDGINLGTFGMDLTSDTIHSPKCSKFAELDDIDKVLFSGDREMKIEWSSMGYHLCKDCMK